MVAFRSAEVGDNFKLGVCVFFLDGPSAQLQYSCRCTGQEILNTRWWDLGHTGNTRAPHRLRIYAGQPITLHYNMSDLSAQAAALI